MRKQEKVMIWPIYFDSARSRKTGRRVSKALAISSPRIAEVSEAIEKLGLNFELVPNVAHPKTPWSRTGMLLVEKEGSKNRTSTIIVRQILKMRSSTKSE